MTEATASVGAPERLSDEGVSVRPVDRPGAMIGIPAPKAGSGPAAVRSAAPLLVSPAGSEIGERLNPAHRDTRYVEEPATPGAVTTSMGVDAE
ncbi:hypothetical protein [Streptomyces sp. enrichment culture]|uniref:hypothetical protein n=1 Tax=Streptomyces sp. enrichment culture TaxID=1795815 RepID=UPI003F564EE1